MYTIGVFANPYKNILQEKLPELIQIMVKSGLRVACPEGFLGDRISELKGCDIQSPEDIASQVDFIFTFGGDGTVLRTIHLVKDQQTPILAVNVGGLGFLTEVLLEDFEKALQSFINNDFGIEERMLLEGTIEGDSHTMYVLNEITIEKGKSTRVIEIRVDIDGRYFNDYIADGLIISTPTGSTGYSLSSGGPIIVPTSDCIILNPICPHSLTNRPVIIPGASRIKAQLFTDQPEGIIAGDSLDMREVPSKTVLNIRKSPYAARLIKYRGSDYFSLLRNKLSWGEDFRNKLRWSSTK